LLQERKQPVSHPEYDAVIGRGARREAAEVGGAKGRCESGFASDGNQGRLDVIAERNALRFAQLRN
jgi:hypothetical protein